MQATGSEVDIGRRTYLGYEQYFSGSLSGVAVYNRALSASQVANLYSNGLAAASATITSAGTAINSFGTTMEMSVAFNAENLVPGMAKTEVGSNFNILISGRGSVVPNLNGKALHSGKKYTLTAIAANGWVFANWVCDNEVVGTSSKYSFLVGSNLVMQANFIPNPFLPFVGTYQGLFSVPNDAAEASSGAVVITVTRTGAFSAKLRLGARSYPFSGEFSDSGAALTYVPRSGLSPLTVQLRLGSANGHLTGAVSDNIWTAVVVAEVAVNCNANSAPQAGKYALRFAGSENASAKPGGSGFGAVTVSALGTVTFRGMLGDGTPVICTSIVTSQGHWPFFVSLYAGTGSMLGWLSFTDEDGINGQTFWFKLPQATAKSYPGGFTQSVEAIGSICR
jgi:hypothetical protein